MIRYEGEGKSRRPIYEDLGPASGNGRGDNTPAQAAAAQLSALAPASRLVGVGEPLTGGAGRIERSQASAAQREAWRAADERPSPIAPTSFATTHESDLQRSRLRGGETTRARHSAVRHPWAMPERPATPPPEEPVMPDPPAPADTTAGALQAVAVAAAAAGEAWQEVVRAKELIDVRLAEWDEARGSLQEAYAGLGPMVVDGAPAGPVAGNGVSNHAPEYSDVMPEPVPTPAARMAKLAAARADAAAGGGPETDRQPWIARMLEALVATEGDFTEAAARLGIKRSSLAGSMGRLRTRTDLTDAERAVVARKR